MSHGNVFNFSRYLNGSNVSGSGAPSLMLTTKLDQEVRIGWNKRRGQVSVIREHYLRDDIPCRIQQCSLCDQSLADGMRNLLGTLAIVLFCVSLFLSPLTAEAYAWAGFKNGNFLTCCFFLVLSIPRL